MEGCEKGWHSTQQQQHSSAHGSRQHHRMSRAAVGRGPHLERAFQAPASAEAAAGCPRRRRCGSAPPRRTGPRCRTSPAREGPGGAVVAGVQAVQKRGRAA